MVEMLRKTRIIRTGNFLTHLRLSLILCLLFMIAMGTSAQDGASIARAQTDSPEYRVVGYYTAWSLYARQYFVTDVPADKLTHINYAFINISRQGECVLGDEGADIQYPYPNDPENAPFRGNFRQLLLLKEEYPHLKVLMSIGGWTWSGHFSGAARTEESRRIFVQSCITLMAQYGFDGIDVDWEFPVSGGLYDGLPEDKVNFTLLLAEFRRQLDEQGAPIGRHYLLTIAAPAPEHIYSNLELDQIHPYLNWINIMAYDFHGGWNTVTNHGSPLFTPSNDPDPSSADDNADAVIQAYIEAGVPADKIVIGVPFYGRGWGGVPPENNGLYQPFESFPPGTWNIGVFDFSDLQDNYLGWYSRYWDAEARSSWLYNPRTEIMITYEDPESLLAKAAYVREYGLGGMMFWELSNDDDEHTLLTTIHEALDGQP